MIVLHLVGRFVAFNDGAMPCSIRSIKALVREAIRIALFSRPDTPVHFLLRQVICLLFNIFILAF